MYGFAVFLCSTHIVYNIPVDVDVCVYVWERGH